MIQPSRTAIFAGSFDPITVGHEDVVRRGLRLVDRMIVAVAHRPSEVKRGMFSVEERVEMIAEVFAEEPEVEPVAFDGLLVEFARQRGARVLLRGLRGPSDFEYETRMARMNATLAPEMETVFLAARLEHGIVSSSLVREVATLGGNVEDFVSPPVLERLRRRTGG